MIDPKAINLAQLPSVSLTERKDLPAIPGIYFAIDSQGTVQYIGRSVNIQQRWAGHHHRVDQLKKMEGVKIAYLSVDAQYLLPEAEAVLIKWFNPPMNGVAIEPTLSFRRWITSDPFIQRMIRAVDDAEASPVSDKQELEKEKQIYAELGET